MKCTTCKVGDTKPGTCTETFERNGCVVVIKDVPAEVCDTCGESYTDTAVTERLLQLAQEAERAGVEVQVQKYVAA